MDKKNPNKVHIITDEELYASGFKFKSRKDDPEKLLSILRGLREYIHKEYYTKKENPITKRKLRLF